MIEFHADDYGLFPEQSRRILRCREQGVLNAVSIFPNSPDLQRCLEQLDPVARELRLTIHLNLMEGKSLCPPEELPLLVDGEGVFTVSFASLLLAPLTGKYGQYRQQLKRELSAQIHALLPYLQAQGAPLRLDGHAHWHVVPVVFDALMDVIREEKLPVEYIRMPAEPVGLFFRHLPALFPFHPINIVKSLLLHLLSGRNLRRHGAKLRGMERKLFLGVLFSGHFDYDKIRLLLPDLKAEAARRGWGLELLLHPGAVYEEEDIRALTNRDDLAFLTSPDRRVEAEALCRLKKEEAHD